MKICKNCVWYHEVLGFYLTHLECRHSFTRVSPVTGKHFYPEPVYNDDGDCEFYERKRWFHRRKKARAPIHK